MGEKSIKDKREKIVIVILVAVIILLLLHNCTLVKKKHKDKVPSGNVNIIEIMCEDDNKCNIDNNDIDNNKNATSNDDNKNTTDNGTNRTSTNKETSNDTKATGGVVDDKEVDTGIEIVDHQLKWSDVTPLKIFTDSVYQLEDKIAPESSNTYQFVVKNSTRYNLKYDISFIETNPYHINMKYKLKKNDTYLVDHYVSYDELNIQNQLLNSKANDTYYLEWRWVSSDADNEAGEHSAEYSLKIEVKAESTNG